jgi:tight adherence protein C
MIITITVIFAVAIYFIIRQFQLRYNTILVARRVENTGGENSGKFKLFKLLIKVVSGLNSNLPIKKYREKLEKKLIKYKSAEEYTPDEFLAHKELMAVTGLIILVILFETVDIYIIGITLGLFAYPDIKINNKKEYYEKQLLKELPFFLDIITVCVEAGLTFDNAILKYVSKARSSILREEFENYLKDINIGKSRADALKDMYLRVNIQDFTSFICSIIQSEKMGTSVAGTLRIQTRQIRIKRVQRIEKQAMQAPIKLMIPLVLFIFPVIFIVIFGPVIIRIIKML